MPSLFSRRRFLGAAATTGLAALAAPTRARAIDPISRTGQAPPRHSVAAYSYRKYLDLKTKPKPAMTLDDFIDRAAAAGCPAVELTQYYFPETTPAYLARLKLRCSRLGMDVSGTAISNDFCVNDAAKRKEQIAHVKAWVEHSARLGAKTI